MVWSKNESRMGCRRMIGREKVIKGLELCTNISQDGCLMLCPYKDEKDETYSGFCEQVLKQDALALLKEQEAVEPIHYHRSDGTIFKYECRQCRTKIFKMDLFCRHCGRSVKWE